MVKVAIAGGTGNVASEIIEAIQATKKHEITILTRKENPTSLPGLRYVTADYTSRPSLLSTLRGQDVVLSFLVVHQDEDSIVQKNLIHACIEAGVKRFAPSEWGVSNGSGIPPYAHKDEIAAYLAEINKEKKVLEYCLFQPSLFMDYFAHPHALATHLYTWPFFVDYQHRRAMRLDAGTQPIVLTAIRDVAAVVALALDYPGEWPTVGGIRGSQTSINELIKLGEEIRGGKFAVEEVSGEDVENGVLKTSWVPWMDHPVVPVAERSEAYSRAFTVMFLVGIKRGAWDVGGQWNERLPEYRFKGAEEYLREAWKGKK
ncbi:NmrA-like family protein-like protein [Lophium mytilinum]|uniref:NmrA-like family protein-like protein n=1 Tax=Lophium mytilinum TaxID=390894 RepID=A0A6A6QFM6_9PEZI|nr:NmrA-like family protein-like protein [Lophium mytilinum]